MKRNWGKRMVSGTLAGILVLGFVPSSTFAVEADGLCAHHTQHTADCGYSAAIESSTCGCQPDEKGVTAHTEGCGYVEASEAKPCTFVCEECAREHTHVFDENQKCDCGAIGGSCGTECVWVFDPATETLTVTGEGQTYDYGDPYEAEWWQVGDSILDPNQAVKHVVVEPGITRIGDYTFACLDQAESTILPEGLLSLGHDSFGTSSNQITQVLLPSTLENIETAALYGLPVSEIVIPESVKKIGACALPCAIESITFHGNAPQRLDTVSGMESVPMLHGITATAYYPAEDDTWTDAVKQSYGGTITWVPYDPAEDIVAGGKCGENLTWMFDSESGLLTISGTGSMDSYSYLGSDQPWYSLRDKITDVMVENGVTAIGSYAFYGCKNLRSAQISDGVISLEASVFSGCEKITEIVLPDTLADIGRDVFSNCDSLTSIILPDSVTTIGLRAFYMCDNLESVTLPRNLSYIGTTAFMTCPKLKEIYFRGDSCTIEDNAFSSIKATAYYPDNNPTWTENVMQDYGGTITWESYVPAGVIASGTCGADGDNLKWVLTDDGKLTISGEGAMEDFSSPPWYDNQSDITSVFIDTGVTSIGNCAFKSCRRLTSVTIPSSVTHIGTYAFCYCNDLTSIIIPDSVTSIGDAPFLCCASLQGIWVSDENPNYSNDEFGVLFDKEKSTLIQCPGGIEGDYIIPSSVTDIHRRAFEECNHLTNVTMPDGLCSVGYWAFYSCISLTSINIPDSVTSIESGAFQSCSKLARITIPSSVTNIGKSAFRACCSLQGIWVSDENPNYSNDEFGVLFDKEKSTLIQSPGALEEDYIIPDSVTSIGDYAFDSCNSMTSISIPDVVTSIGNGAFEGCSSLTSITIPDGVTSIKHWTFYDCASLTSINIPDSVTSIGVRVFSDCTSLTSFTIPDSVASIGSCAFEDCCRLVKISFNGNAPSIDNNTFAGVTATAYYPADNSSWTDDVMQDYGGNITWKPSHSWAEDWSKDDTYHWHECTAEDCDVTENSGKDGYGAHVYDDDADTTCNTCGYIRTVEPPAPTDPSEPESVPVTPVKPGWISWLDKIFGD